MQLNILIDYREAFNLFVAYWPAFWKAVFATCLKLNVFRLIGHKNLG